MPRRSGRERFGGKILFVLMGLAGLGVGVWLFGKRRSRDELGRRSQNGS